MQNWLKIRKTPTWTNLIFLGIMAALFLASPSGRAENEDNPGQPLSKLARCSWDAPTYGTPVHHYVLQVIEMGGEDIDTTTYSPIFAEYLDVCVSTGRLYKARVAGVDSLNRQGPWSLITPPYGPRIKPNVEYEPCGEIEP